MDDCRGRSLQVSEGVYGTSSRGLRRNRTATWSLVLGVLGIFTCGVTSPFAVVLGHIAAARIRGADEFGFASARAGLVTGWLMLLAVSACLLLLAFSPIEAADVVELFDAFVETSAPEAGAGGARAAVRRVRRRRG